MSLSDVVIAEKIDPDNIYSADGLRKVLRLSKSSLANEIRRERLRASRRCGRYWFKGEWVLDWISRGSTEVKTRIDNAKERRRQRELNQEASRAAA